MADTPELTALHRTIDELRAIVGSVRSRYGDIPAVKRLIGDIDRMDLDAAELDELPAPAETAGTADVQILDDTPPDPSLWADADDEGVGGYHRGASR